MGESKLINSFFKSEKLKNGTSIVTILKDNDNFFGVSMKNCRLITNSEGYIDDEFTDEALKSIQLYIKNSKENISETSLKLQLRTRMLNRLIGMI